VGSGRTRVPAAPRDWSETLGLPAWLDALLSRDAVAYPLHAILGASLGALGGPAALAGEEWLKAAAHAQSAGRLARAARGLARARRRLGDADAFERLVAAALIGGSSARKPVATYRGRQLAALALMGGVPADGAPPARR